MMAVKRISLIAIGVAALAGSGLSTAQQYRPDEYLALDLSRAVLSPKPLGPAQSFTPGPLDVTVDHAGNLVHAIAEPPPEPETMPHFVDKTMGTRLRASASGVRAAHARVERAARRKPPALVALHGRNPLEAQARDSSIHVWPCKSGGICDWKR
jgi:hypothetical protein